MPTLLLLIWALVSICPAFGRSTDVSTTAWEATYQTKTYNATMDKTSVISTRLIYDGHGNLKIQNLQEDGSISLDTLYTRADDSMYQLRAGEKIALNLGTPAHSWDAYVQDWVKEPPTPELQALGERIISDHNSHGYKGKALGVNGEIWIADDIRIPVLSKSDFGNGTLEFQLVDYQKKEPIAAFELPSDYTQQTSSNYMLEKSGGHTRSLDLDMEDRTRLEVFLSIAEAVAGQQWMETAHGTPVSDANGTAVVKCKLNPDGTLTDIKLTKSSGNTQFDDVTLLAVGEITSHTHGPEKISRTFEANFTFTNDRDFDRVRVKARTISGTAADAGNSTQ